MENLVVSRLVGDKLVAVGIIDRETSEVPTFAYEESYLARESALPLSLSLPLGPYRYDEQSFRPYFEGLLPEGQTRTALAARAAAREDDYLTLLVCGGFDCIGDVVVREVSQGTEWDNGSYTPLSEDDLRKTLRDLPSLASSNLASRLSLAGTQGKVGLAHMPGMPMANDWLRPEGGAASTHILKVSNLSRIAEFELVCMTAAEQCGISVARTCSFSLSGPIICSERYDRRVSREGDGLRVTRLHQEDLAQAFGVTPRAKYLELEGGSYHAIAQLVYERSSAALADIDQLVRVSVFNYLVGNCDNHLKNLSVLHSPTSLRLAPVYDLVCTTFFERFSREMGMRIGSTRVIDDICPDDFHLLAGEIGMGTKRMRRICTELAERVTDAVSKAGEMGSATLESLPYTAEDLLADMTPRLAVVAAV